MYFKRRGWYHRDIAAALDVSEEALSRWFARARSPEALRAQAAAGKPPMLSAAEVRSIPELLWHGPEAYGFRCQV